MRQFINEVMIRTGAVAAAGFPIITCKVYSVSPMHQLHSLHSQVHSAAAHSTYIIMLQHMACFTCDAAQPFSLPVLHVSTHRMHHTSGLMHSFSAAGHRMSLKSRLWCAVFRTLTALEGLHTSRYYMLMHQTSTSKPQVCVASRTPQPVSSAQGPRLPTPLIWPLGKSYMLLQCFLRSSTSFREIPFGLIPSCLFSLGVC